MTNESFVPSFHITAKAARVPSEVSFSKQCCAWAHASWLSAKLLGRAGVVSVGWYDSSRLCKQDFHADDNCLTLY